MAWENGTATDHVDLFNKLRSFLLTNTDLVNASEEWTQVLGNTGALGVDEDITLQGSGSGTNLYCSMRLIEDVVDQNYAIQFWAHAGFSASLTSENQPLRSIDCYLPCWDQSQEYWFIANDRRWIVVLKIGTVYLACYCGFYLPYGTPSEFPFPCYVGGCTSGDFVRWNVGNNTLRFFGDPVEQSTQIFTYENIWRSVSNRTENSSSSVDPSSDFYVFPFVYKNTQTSYHASFNAGYTAFEFLEFIDTGFDGSHFITPLQIHAKSPTEGIFGILDGAHWVSGRGVSAEDIITIQSQDFLIVPNVFRSDFRDYMALRLS